MPNRSAHLLLPRAKSSTALLLLLLPSLFVEAVSVNVTVDDTIPDPVTGATFTYAPTGRWNVGNNCTGCLAQPDPSLVYDGTWHDATYSRTEIGKDETQTAQISFNGYALYVYGIVSQSTISPNSTADISFYIDGELSGVFTYTPPGESSYLYNVCLYANDSLSAGSHSFMLQNGVAGGITSLVLFDYIIYTQDRRPEPDTYLIVNCSSCHICNSISHFRRLTFA
ncbi:hypothetical protein NM688_g2044 [Phlebia brevispora]|uniref:Uncharacterized protein n=1 Tax=Phlebia brevispora TaxID=194682 RepID=A0ACC1T9L7_9APHY|nr:hypothetical protein NM688_g2044 [Phlebia brevispora]